MGSQAVPAQDTEADRRQRVEDMAREHGGNWAAQYAPGSFGCHELLDRTALVADALEQQVLSHPSCVRDPEWFALAQQAVATVRELYQRVGAEHLDERSS